MNSCCDTCTWKERDICTNPDTGYKQTHLTTIAIKCSPTFQSCSHHRWKGNHRHSSHVAIIGGRVIIMLSGGLRDEMYYMRVQYN